MPEIPNPTAASLNVRGFGRQDLGLRMMRMRLPKPKTLNPTSTLRLSLEPPCNLKCVLNDLYIGAARLRKPVEMKAHNSKALYKCPKQ